MRQVQGPVALITAGELFGGVERHVLSLGTFLQERGLEPRIVLFHDRELARQSRDAGLPVDIVSTRGAWDLAGPRHLEATLSAAGVALVHVHGYRAAVNVALASTRWPFVCTVHGQGEPTWRMVKVFLKDRTYRAAEAWACSRRQAQVCFVTDDLRRRHGHRYGRLTLQTVHNGIAPMDRDAVPVPEPDLVPGRLHALAVGRLTRIKGLAFALAALAKLPSGPGAWHLDLVGDGGRKAELAAEARRLGVSDRVTFHGFRRDVAALMVRADALVMPSLHEGLPYAVLEAMSLGLPIVASAVGGLLEVLHDGETALLVPVGDVDGLAAALARLAGSRDLRRQIGAAAAADQRSRFSLAAMGEAYLQIYRQAAMA